MESELSIKKEVMSLEDSHSNVTEENQDDISANIKSAEIKESVVDSNVIQQTDYGCSDSVLCEMENSTLTITNGSNLATTEIGDSVLLMEYRHAGSDNDSASSVSSDDESGPESGVDIAGSSDDSENERPVKDGSVKAKKAATVRTKGELTVEDLPPIEDLQITVDDSVHLFDVGNISAVVGVLVIVQGKPDMPALNTDSILFIEGRKSLGQVFETFGPVVSPLYSIRFNSPEKILEKEIKVGMTVYYAPEQEEYTKYVFINQLSVKGSDASWEHNNEPPARFLDYSDDEAERRAKHKGKYKHIENDKDEGNKENNERRPRKRHREKHQGANEQGQSQNQQDQREHSFTSWPPHRSELRGESSQRFRPPPPPQIIPEGYVPPPYSGPGGFRMRQPRPFRPQGRGSAPPPSTNVPPSYNLQSQQYSYRNHSGQQFGGEPQFRGPCPSWPPAEPCGFSSGPSQHHRPPIRGPSPHQDRTVCSSSPNCPTGPNDFTERSQSFQQNGHPQTMTHGPHPSGPPPLYYPPRGPQNLQGPPPAPYPGLPQPTVVPDWESPPMYTQHSAPNVRGPPPPHMRQPNSNSHQNHGPHFCNNNMRNSNPQHSNEHYFGGPPRFDAGPSVGNARFRPPYLPNGPPRIMDNRLLQNKPNTY